MIIAVLMAAAAYSMLSLGFVLQKRGIAWIGWTGAKDKQFYQALIVWIIGFIVMNTFALPSAIALKILPSHIVAAFAGWGIIMLVVFSFLFLQEKIFASDYFYFLLVVLGIVGLNYFEPGDSLIAEIPSFGRLLPLCIFPLILLLIPLMRSLPAAWKTRLFAAASGVCSGLMVICLRLLVLSFGYRLSSYFASVYLYVYLAAALISLLGLQLALKSGPMIAAGPVQYSAAIIYPFISAWLVFHHAFHPVQFLAMILMVMAVTRILKKH